MDHRRQTWKYGALKMLQVCYRKGSVSKEDCAAALRAHQAAVDATKSPQRETAEAIFYRLGTRDADV